MYSREVILDGSQETPVASSAYPAQSAMARAVRLRRWGTALEGKQARAGFAVTRYSMKPNLYVLRSVNNRVTAGSPMETARQRHTSTVRSKAGWRSDAGYNPWGGNDGGGEGGGVAAPGAPFDSPITATRQNRPAALGGLSIRRSLVIRDDGDGFAGLALLGFA